MKPPSAHQTLNPPKHILKRSGKTKLDPNFLWICLLKRESITYYSTIATYRNPCGGNTNHRLENSYSTTNPKNWLTPVLINHKPKGGYGSPSSLLRDRGLTYVSKEEGPQANLRRTDGRTDELQIRYKSPTKTPKSCSSGSTLGVFLLWWWWCAATAAAMSDPRQISIATSAVISANLFCHLQARSYEPRRIVDHGRFRAWRAPPTPLDRLHECVAIGSWTHAVPDGRTDGPTAHFASDLPAGLPFYITSFYIFGYPVQPCIEIWRYILRLFSFNIIILAKIYSRKKKKKTGKKSCSLTVRLFFYWRSFAKKMTKFIFYSCKMKLFWKVSIGNRSEGEKIARFLYLVFSV
jgi:hypothetical protein